VSVWPKGPFAEAVADEIWDTVSDRNEDVLKTTRKRAEQTVPRTYPSSSRDSDPA
jgi:hypothetical protein